MRRHLVILAIPALVTSAALLAVAPPSRGTASVTRPQWFQVHVSLAATGQVADARRGSVQLPGIGAFDTLQMTASVENVGTIFHTGTVTLALTGPSGTVLAPITTKVRLDRAVAPNEIRRGTVQVPVAAVAFGISRTVATAGEYTARIEAVHVLESNDPAGMRDCNCPAESATVLVK